MRQNRDCIQKSSFLRHGWVRLVAGILFATLVFAGVVSFAAGATDVSPRWAHEAYVWQRQHNAKVLSAIQNTPTTISSLCVLVAEVSWEASATASATKQRAVVVRVSPDYRKLAAMKKPVGVALRVGAFGGAADDYAQTGAAAKTLAALAANVLAQARAGGLEPAELQVDFDCAEAKLAAYRGWLAALRDACGRTPLVFTALPVWLRHEEEFVALAAAADGFVLQVHSLEKPADIHAPFVLCDPVRSLAWVRHADMLAARAGAKTRFRIALPTYGFELGFDAAGKFTGVAAERPRDWPAGTQRRTVRADAAAMARLAKTLAAQKLARADGVIWFRLPVADDRLAWDAQVFAAVVAGKPIVSRLTAQVRQSAPGLFEVVAHNSGQTTLPLPREIRLTWPAAGGVRVSAADGLRGYVFEADAAPPAAPPAVPPDALPDASPASSPSLVRARLRAAGASAVVQELAPRRSVVLGWLRFDFPAVAPPTDFIRAVVP